MRARVLIAGIGNVFLGDDGFGVEVARRLADVELPPWAQVADYGISGVHLAFDLLGGYDTTILVDATPRGEEPGTISVLELRDGDRIGTTGAAFDGHGMQPDAVLALLDTLGGDAGRVLIVGCEPADLGHRIGLSDPVRRAVDPAVRKVIDLLDAEKRRFEQQPLRQEV
ncbi:hydrogenase maturation protease [Saccharopolyspora phatthalungensis]|uniref:Hydrogenase maturation protease n=1 Tax=Saccharopolyspora phatthalungensis TaxID=664693 RepID=A0A840Q1A6_9PSEU|nr:hydrogenase maturation protease [Saccharopolyspora phatthalungensis]MBB5152578.1 hydrogenase maturation protease [Saccharopolyspora phatthalungensis]